MDDEAAGHEALDLGLPDLTEQVDLSTVVLLMRVKPEKVERAIRVHGHWQIVRRQSALNVGDCSFFVRVGILELQLLPVILHRRDVGGEALRRHLILFLYLFHDFVLLDEGGLLLLLLLHFDGVLDYLSHGHIFFFCDGLLRYSHFFKLTLFGEWVTGRYNGSLGGGGHGKFVVHLFFLRKGHLDLLFLPVVLKLVSILVV